MGKTAFALSVVKTACEAGYRVAYFSMEMMATELVKRLIRSYGDDEIGAGKISAYKLHIFDRGGVDLAFIRSSVRLIRDCHLAVIDYVGLMSVNTQVNRNEAIGEVSRGLKSFALEAEIPILLLSQLNRDSESRGSLRHRLSDIRESGNIEQDADKVFFITRPGILNDDMNDKAINIQKEKDRNGKSPVFYELVRDESFTNFYDKNERDTDYQTNIGNRGGQAF